MCCVIAGPFTVLPAVGGIRPGVYTTGLCLLDSKMEIEKSYFAFFNFQSHLNAAFDRDHWSRLYKVMTQEAHSPIQLRRIFAAASGSSRTIPASSSRRLGPLTEKRRLRWECV